jgi:hypothetical protein
MNYLVLSPFTGASVASFHSRAHAEQFASELNACECAEIERHNASEKAVCAVFRAPFVPQYYRVCEPSPEFDSDAFFLRTYSL